MVQIGPFCAAGLIHPAASYTEYLQMTPSEKAAANKVLVLALLKGAFVERDSTVFDRLLGASYTQHNPQIPDGLAGIKAAAAGLPPNLKYEPGMVVAEGDYVMVHGRYADWGPKPMIAVDIFRVADGKVIEHWDVMQEEVPAQSTASGNGMFTNPQA